MKHKSIHHAKTTDHGPAMGHFLWAVCPVSSSSLLQCSFRGNERLHRERKKYWSKYHKNAIDKGYLTGWAMFQVFGKSTAPNTLGNLVFVKNFSSLAQIANMTQM